jgi:hypothetical protein
MRWRADALRARLNSNVSLMYCPNCNAHVAIDAANCLLCNADFGANSAWRPVPLGRAPKRRSEFWGAPRVGHAVTSVALFAGLGPLFGNFLLAVNSGERDALLFAFHPFFIAGAFAIGFVPALLAGLLYCVLSLTIISVAPRATVRGWSGALLGAFAGGVAAAIFSRVLFAGAPDFSVKMTELIALCIPAGLVAGPVSGWLLPIGLQRTSNIAASHES